MINPWSMMRRGLWNQGLRLIFWMATATGMAITSTMLVLPTAFATDYENDEPEPIRPARSAPAPVSRVAPAPTQKSSQDQKLPSATTNAPRVRAAAPRSSGSDLATTPTAPAGLRTRSASPSVTSGMAVDDSAPGSGAGASAGKAADYSSIYSKRSLSGLFKAQDVNQQQGCNTCTINNGQKLEPSCQPTYEKLFNKEPVDIRVVVGYTDNRSVGYTGANAYQAGLTQDRYITEAMIERFTAKGIVAAADGTPWNSCEAARNDCGFTRDPDDKTLLTRQIKGPDGYMHTVRLTIASSSASDNDQLNRTGLESQQKALTERNKAIFFDGLHQADVLLYVGHMRKGGGPDFAPPELRADGRVDYSKYDQGLNRGKKDLGYNRMMWELAHSKQQPMFIGLLACDSEQYAANVRAAAPNSGVALIGSGVTYQTAFSQASAILDSVLNYRCQAAFNQLINAGKDNANNPVLPIAETNFFRNTQSGSVASYPPRNPIPGVNYADPNGPDVTTREPGSQPMALPPPVPMPLYAAPGTRAPGAPAAAKLRVDDFFPPTTNSLSPRY